MGGELAALMFEHATSLGAEVVYTDVLSYDLTGKIKTVRTHEGTFEGKTVILCMGASARQLNVEGEKKFIGRGVSYCATCDGKFFEGKDVAIVGGGNTSLEDALFLTNLCKKVYLIHRRDEFRGDSISANEILRKSTKENSNLVLILNSQVVGIEGDDKVASITISNKLTKQEAKLAVDALFIAIGRKPDTDLIEHVVSLDESGYILTSEKMETNVPGVYAAGDVRKTVLRQICTACADGAVASVSTNEFIRNWKN